MKKSIERVPALKRPEVKELRNNLDDDDYISEPQHDSIQVNDSPRKRTYKDLKNLSIKISNDSNQSQILEQQDPAPSIIIHNPTTLSLHTLKPQSKRQSLQKPQLYRTPHNRFSKMPSQQERRQLRSPVNPNEYNETAEERGLSRRVLNEYLRNVGCRDGDFVEIKSHQSCGFVPVYKLVSLKEAGQEGRKASDDGIIVENNSLMRNKSHEANNNQKAGHRKSLSTVIGKSQSSSQLTMGSNIFLKHEKFNHLTSFSANKLSKLPILSTIFVYLEVKSKGNLICIENASQVKGADLEPNSQSFMVDFEVFEEGEARVHGIWRCVMAEGYRKYFDDHITEEDISRVEEEKYVVRFVNFITGKCLAMDDQCCFYIDDISDKGSRFILRHKPGAKDEANWLTLQKAHDTSTRDFEPAKHLKHTPYEQSKRIPYEYEQSKRPYLQTKPPISVINIYLHECQQSVIKFHQQLLYIKSKLSSNPSLKLIEVILQTMIPYSIPELTPNLHIVSEYIQKVFYEQGITKMMADWIEEYLETEREQMVREGLESIVEDELGEVSESGRAINSIQSLRRIQQRNSKGHGLHGGKVNQPLVRVIKYLNRLCLHSCANSEACLPILDSLFTLPLKYYTSIIYLASNNCHFLAQFYKRQWYQKLIRSILSHKTDDPDNQQGFQPYFLVLQKFCTLNNTSQVENQFLIYHTIKQPEFQAKNILLNLYVEGLYIFVREGTKDMELMTYLQANQTNQKIHRKGSEAVANSRESKNSSTLRKNSQIQRLSDQTPAENRDNYNRNSKRFSILQKSLTFKSLLHKIVLYLQVLQMLGYGYNYTILRQYTQIIEKLLSYCNKQKLLVIKDYDFTRWVLKCAYSFYQSQRELRIFPRFKLGIVDSASGEAKFKQKVFNNQFFPLVLAGLGEIRAHIITPRIPEKESLQMCNIFLAKCKQYYGQIKGKQIRISEIFETGAINNEPVEEYFDFLKVLFGERLLKFKEKKKAQLMQYLQKLFENVFPQERVEQTEESLISVFVKLLLKVISYDQKYQKYLQTLKITAEYHETKLTNQLITHKKFNIKKLNVIPSSSECSKLMKIKLVNTYLDKHHAKPTLDHQRKHLPTEHKHEFYPRMNADIFKTFETGKEGRSLERMANLKQPTQTHINLVNRMSRSDRLYDNTTRLLNDNANDRADTVEALTLLEEHERDEKYLSLQSKALELLILIMLNINEEYIEQSIETLNYFIKNPRILNLSSFELFSSVPKYENEFGIRRRILEQWYLVSEPQTLELLTTVLRLLHRKVSIHINRISSVQIVTDSDLSEISTYIADNVKEIDKMSSCIQTWFKEQLFVQNADAFGYFDQKLDNVAESLNKSKQLTDCGCVSVPFQVKRILISLNCMEWMKRVLSHMAKWAKRQNVTTNKNLSQNKARAATARTYQKAMGSYSQKLCFMLEFLIQPMQVGRLRSQQQINYLAQYESTLQYMQAILCILGEHLSQLREGRYILVRMMEIALTHYEINLVQYCSDSIVRNLLECRKFVFRFVDFITNYKDCEAVKIANQLCAVMQGMEHYRLAELVAVMTAEGGDQDSRDKLYAYNGYQNENSNSHNFMTEREKEGPQEANHKYEYENSWFYFIFRLNLIRKKYQLQTSTLPLLKLFYKNILFTALENHIKCQDNSEYLVKNKKAQGNSGKLSFKQNKRLLVQIQRRRYLAHFIAEYVDSEATMIPSSKKKDPTQSRQAQNSLQQRHFQLMRQHIRNSLIDISLYQKFQKHLTASESLKHTKNNPFNQTHSLMLEYLEYYIYDLVSLLFLLDTTEHFDKIHDNLVKLNDRLKEFLVDTHAQRVETHYSQQFIAKVIKQLEDRTRFVKSKNPRAVFQQCANFQFFNLKSINFLQPKQIKKIESTALRKWKKAVNALTSTALNAEVQFLYQIDHFSQIYNIKNKEEMRSAINNEDLLKKLISLCLNVNRVTQSTQNKIFILSEVCQFAQSKYFENLVNVQETREYLATTILEQLSEEELIDDNKNEQSQTWSDNIIVICLKLQIVKRLDYFSHEYYASSLQILIGLLKKARKVFEGDSLSLRIAFAEFKQLPIYAEPFYLILTILSEQILMDELGQKALQDVLNQLYLSIVEHTHFDEYQWKFDTQNKVNFTHFTHKRILQKLIDKLFKLPISTSIIQQISDSYKTSGNTNDKKSAQKNDSHLSVPLLEKIQLHAELTYTSIKEKGWNFLVQMGLGAYSERRDKMYGNNA